MITDLDMLWLPLATFAFTACVTPGPNNIMLVASGVNFGFIRTLPHMLGISIGMLVMVLSVSFGLGQLFIAYPVLQKWLAYCGAGYLLFLAWKIATAAKPGDTTGESKPITFIQAGLFQFVNLKGVLMAISSLSIFTLPGDQYALSALAVALMYAVVCFPSVMIWAGFGTSIRRFLDTEKRLRVFNYSLAGLTVGTIVFLFYGNGMV